MTVIGIDIGGSTTKIIAVRDSEIMPPMQVKANDPKTSVYGAFGRYITENGLSLSSVNRIMITGVGSSFITEDIYGIKTGHASEFDAIGKGGLYLSGLESAIIVSMGTGTSFIKADKNKVERLGGTGVGGGTLLGLSSKFIHVRHFDSIVKLAEDGDLSKTDLTVGDISQNCVTDMPDHTTAANFGKVSDYATKNDIAKGLINMILQTIGMMAVFACKIDGTQNVVLCGNLTSVPDAQKCFDGIKELHNVEFIIPKYAEYATALGAALSAPELEKEER